MNDDQRRQYDAAVAGKDALDENTAAYVGNTPLINKVTDLGNAITAVETSEAAQTVDTKGYTAIKNAAKETMAEKAWQIAKPLSIFAKNTGNTVLQNEIDFELSDLLSVADEVAKSRCTLIRARAVTNQAALTAGGYQITAAMTTSLTSAINDFNLKKGQKVTAKSGTKAATVSLGTNMKTMMGISNDILDLSVTYASSNATFYNTLQDAFEVGSVGVRHIAMRVTCNDQVTGVRLENVDVRIVELNITVKSSKRGIADFSHNDVPEGGNYTVTASKNGYVLFTQANVGVSDDKLTKVAAVMVKV